jgi:NAD(P)-dependent dehydrogenase (short-subunit alcohol dehydrogenase family)
MPSVLVTGAGRGFGRALLEEYRRRGWTTFPLVRDRGVADELRRCGERCRPVVADLTDDGAEAAIAAALGTADVPLDLLVNNAGIVRKVRGLAAADSADLEAHFRVHCVGALRATRAALPWLARAERPLVVNVSSRFGSIARTAAGEFRGLYAYHCAKAAEDMLTACLDAELRPSGVRVVAVHPGRLKTPLGAADADVDPSDAARAFADWAAALPRDAPCALYDVTAGGVIDW